MTQTQHNAIVNFIWSIADDVLRDVYTRGKYRDLKKDVNAFFKREVEPFVKDPWYNPKETKIGYEINFAKYFYKHKALRSLEAITQDILDLQKETGNLLGEIIR